MESWDIRNEIIGLSSNLLINSLAYDLVSRISQSHTLILKYSFC